jgi:Ca2+-binding EF-hand superfamily protein
MSDLLEQAMQAFLGNAEAVNEVFNLMDHNHDHKLTKQELRQAILKFHGSIDERRAQQIDTAFAASDADNDGALTPEEFLKFLKAMT